MQWRSDGVDLQGEDQGVEVQGECKGPALICEVNALAKSRIILVSR
jgi:hypothetical protein